MHYQQQSKQQQMQANGMIMTGNHNIRAPRPPVRTVSSSPSPSEQMQQQQQQCNVYNNSGNLQSTAGKSTNIPQQQQQIILVDAYKEVCPLLKKRKILGKDT
uniref:Uncharacterized protein n=1 Tax=Megaselia scalaris TaxID=36166 RepID=T1H1G7_MEGSC